MKISLTKGIVMAWLLTLVMLVSSAVADAAIRFTDRSGGEYILDYNSKTNKGKYMILAHGQTLTFDYNTNTHEFIMYENDELYAVRKFRGENTLVCKEYGSGMNDGVYDRGSDGGYYHEIMKDGIYESTPKAFLLFLKAGGNLGSEKQISVEISGDYKAMVYEGGADIPVVLVNNSDQRYYFDYIDFTLVLKDSYGNPIGTFTMREELNGYMEAHSTVNRALHFEDSDIPALDNPTYDLGYTTQGYWY